MKESIELLYSLYSGILYKYIFSICKDREIAEDIVQITFVEAIKSIDGFRGNSSVKTWLFSIARFQCYKYLRKKKIHINIDDIEVTSYESLMETTIDNICSQEIVSKINDLDEPARSILILRILGDYSFASIGERVGKSESYCRVTFYRAKQKLKKEMREYE